MVQEIGSKGEFSWNKFLFGKISKKLGLAFGILIVLIVILATMTYVTNQGIETDAKFLHEVNGPLNVMVQQVIGYDAILTGNAHEALLHAEKGEWELVAEHKTTYDEEGVKLDNLLKFEARNFINQSRRSAEDKDKVYNILNKLDEINLILVDLETRAFNALEKNDTKTAYSLIVSNNYRDYKKILQGLYLQWASEEEKVSDRYDAQLKSNALKVTIYNIGLGALSVILALIITLIISRAITRPIIQLKEATEQLENGKFNTRVEIKTGDELEDLGNAFNKTIEALGSAEKERNQLDKAKTEFLSITSHELRSPMTPMRAQLQMLLGDYFGKVSKQQRESLEIVLSNTERLDKIIQDFLEISRIEAARLRFNFVKISLNRPIHDLISEMKAFMPEKKVYIVSEVETLPVIECDPDRVLQVLRNLVNNAIKFSKENSKLIIKVEARKNDILFSVKDEGIGIKKQNQIRLFEPFYQVDNMYQHKSGGTGLGLSISKGIVESQNGKIWVESEENKGTTFYFTLPFEPVREMKPIKILFSPLEGIENALKITFLEYLGPIGSSEFEELKKSQKISESALISYVSELRAKGILKIELAEEFKSKIEYIFLGKKESNEDKLKPSKKVTLADLTRSGLVK